MVALIESLKAEPALAWKLVVNVQGHAPDSSAAKKAAKMVKESELVSGLLKGRLPNGRTRHQAYFKWTGAHWIMSLLADLGYPPGDKSIRPMMEQTFGAWLSEDHIRKHLRVIDGRVRRCCSQEGNAAWSSLRLGFADDRTTELIERLLKWQWPDGGWNCDKHPEAGKSSFMETLIPLRALALYAKVSGERRVWLAAERAADIFLKRDLFKRQSTGAQIHPSFVKLHYPCYWHYDILFGLKVMAEAGLIGDPRCKAALDRLESKRLSDGGFPAEENYSRRSSPHISGYSLVSWGGISTRLMNPFVTADALYVLRAAGRL
jgi:hypothetical protein